MYNTNVNVIILSQLLTSVILVHVYREPVSIFHRMALSVNVTMAGLDNIVMHVCYYHIIQIIYTMILSYYTYKYIL